MLEFHATFKPLIQSISIDDILKIVGLENAVHKQLRYFSSGMKQKVKTGAGILQQYSCFIIR